MKTLVRYSKLYMDVPDSDFFELHVPLGPGEYVVHVQPNKYDDGGPVSAGYVIIAQPSAQKGG